MYLIIAGLLFAIPFTMVIQSRIAVLKGKKEQVKWRAALILFIILFLASILINISIVNKYGLNFFSNPFEFATALLVVGLIAGIVAILAFIQLYFFRRGKNTKGIRDMKVYFVGFIGYSILLLFLLAWILPITSKMDYATNLNQAIHKLEKSDKPIALTLVKSDNDCFRSSVRCSDEEFKNVFYIKNNMDEPKNIKLTITTMNKNHEELRGLDSFEISLDAGEYKLIETKYTNDKTSKWKDYTFETKDRVTFYKYRYTFATSY